MSITNKYDTSIKISIIIPTLNRVEYLERTLLSLIHQHFSPDNYEIIIVDGGSIDQTKNLCEILISTNPNHSIYYINEPEPGLLAGRHRGVQEAKGEILIFVDDDIEASSDWLVSIHDAFYNLEIHLVGGKNLPKYETPPPSWLKYLWQTTSFGGKVCGYLSLLDLGENTIKIHPNFVWGLNFAIRRKTLFEIGGFHPDTYPKRYQRFQGNGETGLTMKLFEKGYEALYVPGATLFHIIPADRMTSEYFQKRMFFQGVCDSYTAIRKRKSISIDASSPSATSIKRMVKLNISSIIKHQVSKIVTFFNVPKNVIKLKKEMEQSYRKGYQFHQNEVRNDPELLQWVLKENYWDYQLPSEVLKTYDSATVEKSY